MPLRFLSAVLALTSLFVSNAAPADVQDRRTAARDALAGLRTEHPVGARVANESGLVSFLTTPANRPIPVRAGGNAEQRARAFLAENAALFGLRGPEELVTLRTGTPDRVGMEHVRFQQTYNGYPVTGGEMSVHLRPGGVAAVHSRTLGDFRDVDFRVDIQAAGARERAARALGREPAAGDVSFSDPRLELFNRGHLGGPEFPTRLAWFVEARRIDMREYLWIDARSGIVLLRFSQLTDALSREIYDANDPDDGLYDDLPGTLVRSEGNPDVSGPDYAADANAAYEFSGDTYDYFFLAHGRDSYDDAGATLLSTVHFCPSAGSCPYFNAFWNGTQMVYGEGFPGADDVDAHELTHAVTEYTADLFYYMQSGALNESFSDIFGETVDLTNGGNDPADRWLMGEEIGAIRDMMQPTAMGDPGKTSDADYVCATPGIDSGGVHSNSGVPNHAYALMVDGGTYNSIAVNGIGLFKAGKVQYRALSEYLLSASNFVDNYDALLQSCQDLVGVDGFTQADCDEVQKALDAVEMDHPPSSCATPAPAAVCDVGETVQDLFYEDFEELAGGFSNYNPANLTNWSQQVLSGSGHWTFDFFGPFATSGTGNLWGFDTPYTSDSAVTMDMDVALPAGESFVHFRHSFGFESGSGELYDGGLIEYSTDGGGTWVDAGALIEEGAGYVGTLSNCCENPLAGRSAFAGDSRGYTASRLDLTSLAGEDLRLRFRIGTDPRVDDFGWFIDDFRIYSCEPVCPGSKSLANHTVAAVEFEEACTRLTVGNDGSGDYVVASGGNLTLTAPLVEVTGGFRVEVGGTLAVGPAVP